jgi:hypothetical protein
VPRSDRAEGGRPAFDRGQCQKAQRRELHLAVAVGYVKTDDNRIEKEPDRRVQGGILLVVRKFAELHSIRQVLLWFRQENVLLTMVQGRGKRPIEWKTPVYIPCIAC